MTKKTPPPSHPFWTMSGPDVLKVLDSRPAGLSDHEVHDRQKKYGNNAIRERARLPKTTLFLRQFKSPLILILIVAGIITILLREPVDAAVIFAAVFTNALLGFWQENKAATVLENLKSYIRTRCRVRRNGTERELDASELVPGDILRVEQGDRVPADARILSANLCEADEAVLTGEALPVAKTVPPLKTGAAPGDRTNMLFGGTLIVQGYAEAVVTAIGSQTEFGRIVALTAEEKPEETPLQKSVSRFAAWIGIIILALTAVLFAAGLFSGYDPAEMFIIAVAVAVSAVPEGLPIALTVILAVGVERLAKKKGVVRKLLAAETLGSTDLILTDKTGTLTQAKMTLADVLPEHAKDEHELLEYAVLNTDILIENPHDSAAAWRISGRAMESSLVREAGMRGVPLPALLKNAVIRDRVPFNSTDKYASVTVERTDRVETILMGAPEVIVRASDATNKEALVAKIDALAETGARLLGVSVNGRVMGFFAFRDPVRPTVKSAIRRIMRSGVRTVIVTGDHKGTAAAVAREIGILNGKRRVLTGTELRELREEELEGVLDSVAVFARVTPEQKMMLVKKYKSRGHVVAVTGDGVNDGPALLAADIGVAVGSGTDVAKSAADLVILDDNFETIVRAVFEGRQILGNIRKVIVYLLSDVMNELFLIGGALVAGLALPINALQILFVNFLSDGLPAISFAFEEIRDSETDRALRAGSNVMTRHMRVLILGVGGVGSALLFALYVFLLKTGGDPQLVRTFIFATFSIYTLMLAFSLRGLHRSIFSYPIFSNRYLTGSVTIGIAMTLLIIYAPILQRAFNTVSLPPVWLIGVVSFGVFNVALVEAVKWLSRRINHHATSETRSATF